MTIPSARPFEEGARTTLGGCQPHTGVGCAWLDATLRSLSIRIIVGEDHYLVREGLRQIIGTEADLEVVAYCDDLTTLQAATDEHDPDVVITDIRMPPLGADEGIRFATWARTAHPQLGVVVLSQYAHAEYALRLFASGAARRAYLLKDRIAEAGQLASAIRDVANGGTAVDPTIVEELVAARMQARRSPLADLTPRELEVVSLVAQGKSQRCDRRCDVPDQARRREAHQRDLLQAEPAG